MTERPVNILDDMKRAVKAIREQRSGPTRCPHLVSATRREAMRRESPDGTATCPSCGARVRL